MVEFSNALQSGMVLGVKSRVCGKEPLEVLEDSRSSSLLSFNSSIPLLISSITRNGILATV